MIEERFMLTGSWSVRLDPDTPQEVMAVLERGPGALGHIVITPARIIDPAVTAVTVMAAAIYTGIYRKRPSHWELGGPGLSMWLADEDGKGDIIETALTKAAGTFVQWVTDLKPPSLDAGTYTAIAGTLQHTFQYVDRRTALGYVCEFFGGEWRINPDGTLDAGADSDLFTVTPTVVVQRRSGGADLNVTGIKAELDTEWDYDDYTTRTFLVAHGDGTTTGSANISPATPYKDLNGNAVDLTRIIESSDTKAGNENTVAQAQLNRFTNPREAIRLSADTHDFGHTERFEVGDYIYVYDPELALYDTANEVPYRGQTIHPAIQRVVGATWPIKAGMGVYFRAPDTPGTVTDLTDWIVFETGNVSIDVGANPRSSASGTTGSAVLERPATDSSGLALGPRLTRATDAASPLTLANDPTYQIISETLLDDESGSCPGVAWSDADNRFNVTVSGLFFLAAELVVDSSALADFSGAFNAEFSTSVEVARGVEVPYGNATDIEYFLHATLYIPAGGFVDLRARSLTVDVDITYAQFRVRRLS